MNGLESEQSEGAEQVAERDGLREHGVECFYSDGCVRLKRRFRCAMLLIGAFANEWKRGKGGTQNFWKKNITRWF